MRECKSFENQQNYSTVLEGTVSWHNAVGHCPQGYNSVRQKLLFKPEKNQIAHSSHGDSVGVGEGMGCRVGVMTWVPVISNPGTI